MSILVADDYEVLRHTMSEIVTGQGLNPLLVGSADEAIRRVGETIGGFCDGFGGRCEEVIACYEARGKPVVLVTCDADCQRWAQQKHHPCLWKPFSNDAFMYYLSVIKRKSGKF